MEEIHRVPSLGEAAYNLLAVQTKGDQTNEESKEIPYVKEGKAIFLRMEIVHGAGGTEAGDESASYIHEK